VKVCIFTHIRNQHAQRMATGLAQHGHEVSVILHKPTEIPGVTVEKFAVPRPSLTNPHRWQTRHRSYLRRFVREHDVVVVFFLLDWGFTPELLKEGCVIASPRGSDVVTPPGEDAPPPELVVKRIELLRHASGVGVAGPTFANMVADFAGMPIDRIDRLSLGVDLERFQPQPSRVPKQDGPQRVGFFKGFREVYGAIHLVRAIPLVLEKLGCVRFDLVGEGPQLQACKELAHRLGLTDSIRWLPQQPHDEIPRHLDGWDVSVMPSLCESFGLAALESSAMGVPIVASNVGGIVDTVHDGQTGLLVRPASPESLAEGIVALVNNDELRSRMGRDGRAFVEREYEWHKVLNDWTAMFQRTLDRVSVMV
jgi:glycosyltransferase involved in cell wall biosynthesis